MKVEKDNKGKVKITASKSSAQVDKIKQQLGKVK